MGEAAIGSGILARDQQNRVLVSGTHRSGTTWLGNILAKSPGSLVMHEPFNRDGGIVGVKHWFPVISPDQDIYGPLVDSLLMGRNTRYKSSMPNPKLRDKIKTVLRPDGRRRTFRDALKRPPKTLILKDPLACLLAAHLLEQYQFRIVYTVKHPFAFYDSLLRVGWHKSLPIRDLESQLPGCLGGVTANSTYAAQAAAVWNLINSSALQLQRKHADRVLIVRHEDLCVRPEQEVISVTKFLGIDYVEEMSRYLDHTTNADTVLPPEGLVHEFSRNSGNLPERWRGRLSQVEMDDLSCGTVAIRHSLYPEATENSSGGAR